jgi:hypothetical protein
MARGLFSERNALATSKPAATCTNEEGSGTLAVMPKGLVLDKAVEMN